MIPAQAPSRRPGANEPCWCGSGTKYKRCHRDADRRQTVDEIKDEVLSPKHGHLDTNCDSFHPHTHTAAITQPAFHHKLGLMRREGRTILHIAFPEDLGKDQKLFDAAIANIKEKGIVPHFWSDPSPEELVLGQRLTDRLFGQGGMTLYPSGHYHGKIGRSRIQRTPEGLVGYWGRDGGLGTLLVDAMLDEKEREGFKLPRRLLIPVAMASVLEELESANADVAEWRFPYENENCNVHALEFSHLLSSALGDPNDLPEPAVEQHALGVGLWLARELGRPIAEVLELHRLPEDAAAVLEPYWEFLQAHEDLAETAHAAADNWRRPETASEWASHEEEVEVEEPARELTPPEAAPSEDSGLLVPGVFIELDGVRERYQEMRERIGNELKAIGEQRSALDERRHELEGQLRTLATDDSELAEKALEVERRQIDFEPQERRDLAAALSRLLKRSGQDLESSEDRWQQVLVALGPRISSPQLEVHSSFLLDLHRQRENGTFAQLPASIQQALEQREVEAREALRDLPAFPVTERSIRIPIVFATTELQGRVRLEVVFPRAHGYRPGSLQAELDEAVVEATRLALKELKCQMTSCRVEDHGSVSPGVLVVTAEGDETSSEIVKIAFEDSLGRERALVAAGLSLEVQSLAPEILELVLGRVLAVA